MLELHGGFELLLLGYAIGRAIRYGALTAVRTVSCRRTRKALDATSGQQEREASR